MKINVRIFFGEPVNVVHHGCGNLSWYAEYHAQVPDGTKCVYIACLDSSEECFIRHMDLVTERFGEPARVLFCDREGDVSMHKYTDNTAN